MNDLSELRLSDDEKMSSSPGKRPWKILAVVIGLFVVVSVYLLLSINYSSKSDSTGEVAVSAQQQQGTSATQGSGTTPVRATIMAGGFVEAERSSAVYPGRDGLVEKVYVREGQFVQKGDLLATLDTAIVTQEIAIAKAELKAAELRLQLLLAGTRREDLVEQEKRMTAMKSRWRNAKENLQRFEKLALSGAVAGQEVSEARHLEQQLRAETEAEEVRLEKMRRGPRQEDIAEARANVERDNAALTLLKEKQNLSYVRAPFDGVVIDVKLESGEALSMMTGSEGEMGIKLADVSTLYVKVDIPETSIVKVKTGAKADVAIDATKNTSLQGVVATISPVADRQSNTVEVSVRIENPPSILRPGMSARVSIHLNNIDGGHGDD